MSASTPLLHLAGRAPAVLWLEAVLDVLDGGNHHPFLCDLVDGASSAARWVVKPPDVLSMGNRRDGAINLLAELAGAEVCAWAGVRAPAIGLVRFPDEPAKALSESAPERWRSEVAAVLGMNRGRLGFCSRFLESAVDVDPESLEAEPSPGALGARAALFFVDVYIRHDDRRRENPNAVWLNGEIVALDHGASFVNLDQPGATGADVAARTVVHSRSFHEHVLYGDLARRWATVDFASVARRLASVPDAAIDALATTWPAELEPHRTRFIEFLKHRRAHALDIADNVAKLLGSP